MISLMQKLPVETIDLLGRGIIARYRARRNSDTWPSPCQLRLVPTRSSFVERDTLGVMGWIERGLLGVVGSMGTKSRTAP